MFEELVKCAELLEQFGGHPMAAGLSLREENLEAFRQAVNKNCSLTEADLTPKVVIDVPMPISYVTKELTDQLALLEPFGKGEYKTFVCTKGTACFKWENFWEESKCGKAAAYG